MNKVLYLIYVIILVLPDGECLFVTRSSPNKIFIWNDYLLKDVTNKIHPDWILNIMHGFISQSNVSIFGRPIYITLIARRSNKYAGTRFLKRGANINVNILLLFYQIYSQYYLIYLI